MKKKDYKQMIFYLLIAAVIINLALIVLLLGKHSLATGFSVKDEAVLDADVEFNTDEMFECCSFVDDNGEQRICYAFRQDYCPYCSSYC